MDNDADRTVPGPAKASELCQYLGWLRQVFDLS